MAIATAFVSYTIWHCESYLSCLQQLPRSFSEFSHFSIFFFFFFFIDFMFRWYFEGCMGISASSILQTAAEGIQCYEWFRNSHLFIYLFHSSSYNKRPKWPQFWWVSAAAAFAEVSFYCKKKRETAVTWCWLALTPHLYHKSNTKKKWLTLKKHKTNSL